MLSTKNPQVYFSSQQLGHIHLLVDICHSTFTLYAALLAHYRFFAIYQRSKHQSGLWDKRPWRRKQQTCQFLFGRPKDWRRRNLWHTSTQWLHLFAHCAIYGYCWWWVLRPHKRPTRLLPRQQHTILYGHLVNRQGFNRMDWPYRGSLPHIAGRGHRTEHNGAVEPWAHAATQWHCCKEMEQQRPTRNRQ